MAPQSNGEDPRPAHASQTMSPAGNVRDVLRGWRAILLLVAITAACHLPSLSHAFVNWDDPANITDNPHLQHLTWRGLGGLFNPQTGAVLGNYNPLSNLTFALEKQLTGAWSPALIHFDNVLLHLITTLLVLRLLRAMGLGWRGTFLGALLFGIHPMRVESVAWATERKDVLFAVFYFGALLGHVRWIRAEDRRQKTAAGLLVFLLAALSCLSKVQAVAAPFSLLLLDYWFRRPLTWRSIGEKTPLWLLSLLCGLVNLHTLHVRGSTVDQAANYPFVERLCIGCYSLLVYLAKLVVPYPMSPFYSYPRRLSLAMHLAPAGFLALAVLVWWLGRRSCPGPAAPRHRPATDAGRVVVFGLLFFFVNVMFVLQVFGAGHAFLADRFTYVPYFGLFAVGGWFYERLRARDRLNRWLDFSVAGLAIVMAGLTVRQTGIWRDSGTLWTQVIRFEHTSSFLPYWNRGHFLRESGRFDAALEDYTTALNIAPRNPDLYNSRGKTYFDLAALPAFQERQSALRELAVQDFTTGLDLTDMKPTTRAELLINRGAARAAQGRKTSARQDLDEGLRTDPTNRNGYFNRARLRGLLSDYEGAVADCVSYLKQEPRDAAVWYQLGLLKRVLQRPREAIADLSRALELNPALAAAYRERARARYLAGDADAGLRDYQKAQSLGATLEPMDLQLLRR